MSTQLHIDSYGQGQDLVLLHGWGVNNAVFKPLLPFLSDYRVHLVDLPGFGHSSAMDGDFNQWVDTLAAQLPNQAIWVGWSLGGLLAMQLAHRHPSSVRSLITIASSPCFMANSRDQSPWAGIPANVLQQFSEQLTHNLSQTIEQFLAIQAMGSPHAKADIKALKQLVLAKPLPDSKALALGLSFLESIDLREQIEQLPQPWLRIWGKLDGLVPRVIMRKMPQHSHMQDSLLPKASHAPFISHKDEFLAVLLPWLAKQTHQ